MQQCVKANVGDGFKNLTRPDYARYAETNTKPTDNDYYVRGNYLHRPLRFTRNPEPGTRNPEPGTRSRNLLRLLMSNLRAKIPAMAAWVAMAGIAGGCGPTTNSSDGQVTVFDTSPKPDLTVTVFSPTNTVLNFGMVLYRKKAYAVSVKSMRLLSPAGKAVADVRFTAYNGSGLTVPIGIQGTCPEPYKAHPVTDVVSNTRGASPWLVIVSFKLPKPGTYKLGVVRINYETSGQSGWQHYYLGVKIVASLPQSMASARGVVLLPWLLPAVRAVR